MKKLLIILISVLTILAITLSIIAGCVLSSRKEAPPADIPETTFVPPITEAAETEAPTTEPALPETQATVSPVETLAPTEAVTEAPTEEPEEDFGVEFKKVNRTVYATARANVRTGPAVKYEQIGKLQKGNAVEQIGIGSNGWSRIWFQGKKSYVATEYLTTKVPQEPAPQQNAPEDPSEPMPDFKDTSETVYSTASLNVRSGPSTHYKSIGYLKVGQEAFRVGISETGWSKIRYNSGFGYVSSKYITTEKPEASETKPSENAESPVFREVDEMVCATELLHLRTGPSVNHKHAAYLKPGEAIRRTAVGDNGWSEVSYEGSKLYCSSQYLKVKEPDKKDPPETDKPQENQKPSPKLEVRDENMVASQELVLYSGPDSHYSTQGKLSKGSLVHRTGICDNGWSRILLGGKEVYVVTAYLTEEKKPDANKPDGSANSSGSSDLPEYYTKNEKNVYTLEEVNVRSGPSTDQDSLGKLPAGTEVKRLALGDDGWSLVLFQEKRAYIKSSFLSEDPPRSSETETQDSSEAETYQEVNETVYSTDSVFVRSGPGTHYESLGSLCYGDSVQRTGIGNKGWSRIIWDGETAYASSRYLSSEEPEMPDFGETTTPGFPTPNSPFIYQYVDDPEQIPYAAFEPAASRTPDPLPLVISLHGSAEVGKNREFMEGQHLTKVFREWEYTGLESFDAYVICPHLAKNVPITQWQSKEGQDALFKLIDYLMEVYDVDQSKIILEGHSMGAQGALKAAADPRSPFTKLVIGSGYSVDSVDYRTIQIPVKGYSGGTGDSGPRDDPESYHFMNVVFKDYFGKENWFTGPYTHDDVAIKFFQKDDDGNKNSDIIEWMLK